MRKVLLAALAALAATTAIAQTQSSGKVIAKGETLRIQIYPSAVPQLGLKVAVERGFCKDHGITCELVTIPSGPTGLQALAAGSLEISNSSNDLNMQAVAQGNDFQLIVGTFAPNPYSLAVHKDVPLPNLAKGYPAVMADLKGLKVGVTGRGAATEIQARALLRGAGLDPESSVTFVAVGSPGTAYLRCWLSRSMPMSRSSRLPRCA
ncbi:MAG: ABC transporter substrate-binding protein [Hyphomicrobiaceae bacterium]